MKALTHLDLFSGIGGFSIAAKSAGFQTIAFCEKEPYVQKILIEKFGAIPDAECLRQQQPKRRKRKERRRAGDVREAKALADATRQRVNGVNGVTNETAGKRRESQQEFNGGSPQLHSDIFNLDGRIYGGVDLLTGGFPCQPFSTTGKRRGAEDDRALWPEMLRVIGESKPRWVLGENVPGIISMELDNLLSDLESLGYSAWPIVIPACAVDARHRRERVWIIANANDDSGARLRQHGWEAGRNGPSERGCIWPDETTWEFGSPVRRMAHGIPARSHRLRGLGNAIVPQLAEIILKEIARVMNLDKTKPVK